MSNIRRQVPFSTDDLIPPLPYSLDQLNERLPLPRDGTTIIFKNIRMRWCEFPNPDDPDNPDRRFVIEEKDPEDGEFWIIHEYENEFATINPKFIRSLFGQVTSEYVCTQLGPIIHTEELPEPLYPNFHEPSAFILGALKRVVHPVITDRETLDEFRGFVTSFIHKHFKPVQRLENTHDELDRFWLDNSDYTLREKEAFHEDLERFLQNGPCKNFLHCSSFLKREFYQDIKFPRTINSRSNQFKTVFAPLTKLIEQQVYSVLNKHFVKGKNKQDVVPRLIELTQQFNHIYETDYSSFEGSFSTEIMLACEYQLFRFMSKDNPFHHSMFKKVYHTPNHLHFRCDHRKGHIIVPGSRMSGEMWTSLANGFTNAMLFLFAVKKTQKTFKRFDYLVEGDDGLLSTNFELDTNPITNLGFRLKIQAEEHFNQVNFCGINVCGGQFIPDIPRRYAKFAYTLDVGASQSKKRASELALARALSLAYESSGVPVLQSLAHAYIRLHSNAKRDRRHLDWYQRYRTPMDIFENDFDAGKLFRKVSPNVRQFVEKKFGITIERQIQLETFYDSICEVRV